MPNASLTNFKYLALRKAVERLQHGKLLENQSGDTILMCFASHHMTPRLFS